jgi:hypothetical protein
VRPRNGVEIHLRAALPEGDGGKPRNFSLAGFHIKTYPYERAPDEHMTHSRTWAQPRLDEGISLLRSPGAPRLRDPLRAGRSASAYWPQAMPLHDLCRLLEQPGNIASFMSPR